LDIGIEALYAEACAVDAAEAESLGHRLREGARIDLDRDLSIRQHEVGIAQRADEVGERLRRHDRRRTAAEVDV
jgi:hypothetical protein